VSEHENESSEGETADHLPEPAFAETFFAPTQSMLPVTIGATTHVGKVRDQNEDNFAIFRFRRTVDLVRTSVPPDELPIQETCSYAMVVADGVGGRKSGEIASRLALQTMVELTCQATSWVMKLTDLDAQQVESRVEAYVQRIHEALQVQGRSDPDKRDMATTWTSAHLLGDSAVVVHLGDSRAYLFRDGILRQVTQDETMAQSLIDAGLPPVKVKKFRGILLNCFGGGGSEPAHASVHHLNLTAGDQLLLCTDGLTDMLSDHEIIAELLQHTTPQSACDGLVERALANGGKDNVTAVLAAMKSEA
jgi:serine/threonine protein phosphatase PrpC